VLHLIGLGVAVGIAAYKLGYIDESKIWGPIKYAIGLAILQAFVQVVIGGISAM
jgi:hypothetical protein